MDFKACFWTQYNIRQAVLTWKFIFKDGDTLVHVLQQPDHDEVVLNVVLGLGQGLRVPCKQSFGFPANKASDSMQTKLRVPANKALGSLRTKLVCAIRPSVFKHRHRLVITSLMQRMKNI